MYRNAIAHEALCKEAHLLGYINHLLGHINRSDLEFTWNLPAQWPFGGAHKNISMLAAVDNDYIY